MTIDLKDGLSDEIAEGKIVLSKFWLSLTTLGAFGLGFTAAALLFWAI